MAFAYGWDRGSKLERLRADKRIQGLLKSVNQQKPSRRLTYRKVDPRSVGKKRYLNSRLPGEVLA
jgi:Tfp pilus assembly protein PilO